MSKLAAARADVRDVQNNLAESGICACIVSAPLRELTNKYAACVGSAILLPDESPNGGMLLVKLIWHHVGEKQPSNLVHMQNKPGIL